jgi:ribose transport system substrate-binding protein
VKGVTEEEPHRFPDIGDVAVRDPIRARRAIAALAVGGLVAVLAACGGGDAGSEAQSEPTVSLTVPAQSLNFSQEVAEGFEYAVGAVGGVSARIGGPPFVDGPAQLKVFQDLTTESTDGGAVFTSAAQIFANPLAEAARKGIPLVAVDSPPAPSSQVGLYIGNDNVELGRMLAGEIIAELPPDTSSGTIVLGTTSPGSYVLDSRIAGMQAEFRERLPGVTLKGPIDTKRDVEANRATWGALIKANPEALAFAGTGDADAMSLAAWHEDLKGGWAAGAFDLEPKALLAVKRGDLVVVSPEHYLKGVLAGRLLADRAKNGTALPAGWLRTPAVTVTRANVDEVINRQSDPAAKQAWYAAQADRLLANPTLEPMPVLGG